MIHAKISPGKNLVADQQKNTAYPANPLSFTGIERKIITEKNFYRACTFGGVVLILAHPKKHPTPPEPKWCH